MENRRIVSLGGKESPKKQRLPLSITRVSMKRQKGKRTKNATREGNSWTIRTGLKRPTEQRKPEERVLKLSEGCFRNGILDVKHLLQPASSRDINLSVHVVNKRKEKGRERTTAIRRKVVTGSTTKHIKLM